MPSLYFGDYQIPQRSYVSLHVAQQPMSVDWIYDVSDLYSIIFYDMDAPDPIPNAVDAPFLHYMAVDIPGNNISEAKELMPYMSPNPSSEAHAYFIEVYKQKGKLNARKRRSRKNSQLRRFVKNNNLELVQSYQFYVGKREPKILGKRVGIANISDSDYYIEGSNLDESEQSYCRCLLHVSSMQNKECLDQNAAGLISGGEIINGRVCSNPYAICTNSIGKNSKKCGQNFNFPKLTDNEVMAYAILSNIPIPEPYDRMTLLNNIVTSKLIENK